MEFKREKEGIELESFPSETSQQEKSADGQTAENSAADEAGNDKMRLINLMKHFDESNDDNQSLMNILLNSVKDNKIDINEMDEYGNTALHYAIMSGSLMALHALIRAGTDWGIKNHEGETPFEARPDLFQDVLDKSIYSNDKKIGHEIYFNCSFLGEARKSKSNSFRKEAELDMGPLITISKVHNLKGFLTHPAITCALTFEWNRLKIWNTVNLTFFTLFCLFMNAYVLFFFDSSNLTMRCICYLLIVILILREGFQFVISPKTYKTAKENLLEFVVIVSSIITITPEVPDSNVKVGAALLSSLISCLLLVLLLGRHPKLSTQVQIFIVVVQNYAKFVIYVIPLFAFVTAFHITFRDCSESVCENNDFPKYLFSIYRTLVMGSELNSPQVTNINNTKNFNDEMESATFQIVIILYIFLIPIVFMNLLTGLAVDDSEKIRKDAYLYECIARAKFIKSAHTISKRIDRLIVNCTWREKKFLYKSESTKSKHVHRFEIPDEKPYIGKYVRTGEKVKFDDNIMDRAKALVEIRHSNLRDGLKEE